MPASQERIISTNSSARKIICFQLLQARKKTIKWHQVSVGVKENISPTCVGKSGFMFCMCVQPTWLNIMQPRSDRRALLSAKETEPAGAKTEDEIKMNYTCWWKTPLYCTRRNDIRPAETGVDCGRSPDGWTLLRGGVDGGPTLTGPFSFRRPPGVHSASPTRSQVFGEARTSPIGPVIVDKCWSSRKSNIQRKNTCTSIKYY